MKISPEDPVLTAYALGELDESSRASLEEAFSNDESLAREGAAICSLAGFMSEALQGETFSLGEERRAEILKAGRRPDADVLVLDHRRRSRRQSFMAVVGVAAVVVAGFVGLSRFQTSGPGTAKAGEAAGAPLIQGGGAGQLPGELLFQSGHSIRLPLTIEPVDPSFVERALTETGELPSRELFEIGGWVNAGELVSAPLVTVGNVGIYAELGPCSWASEQALLLVNLRSLDGKAVSMKATLSFNPERVKSSHLLGAVASADSGVPESEMLKGDQTFLYQVELLAGSEPMGAIDLEVEDEEPGYLPLLESPRDEGEISDDFSMARTFGEYARWGASERRDPAILRDLASTAKGLLGKVTEEKARYALDMILLSEESLKK